jgi:signal transduction histidine kinase
VECPKQEVICDEERMVQVMINFLSNAIKNADEKPVHITAKVESGFVEFGVRDHGPGIPTEQQALVFEKFKQLKAETAASDSKKKGTGLGLPIAKALIEQHGGTIGVSSEIGCGAYFFARIPLKQELPLFHAISAAQKN